jgi:hypothetical protein
MLLVNPKTESLIAVKEEGTPPRLRDLRLPLHERRLVFAIFFKCYALLGYKKMKRVSKSQKTNLKPSYSIHMSPHSKS